MSVLCMRSLLSMGICVCLSFHSTLQYAGTCVCIYMYVNTAERLQLHWAVILLLIMKYFVSLILAQLHHATFSTNSLPIAPYKSHPHDTLTILHLKQQKPTCRINVLSLQYVLNGSCTTRLFLYITISI